jgi:hypothetical protein
MTTTTDRKNTVGYIYEIIKHEVDLRTESLTLAAFDVSASAGKVVTGAVEQGMSVAYVLQQHFETVHEAEGQLGILVPVKNAIVGFITDEATDEDDILKREWGEDRWIGAGGNLATLAAYLSEFIQHRFESHMCNTRPRAHGSTSMVSNAAEASKMEGERRAIKFVVRYLNIDLKCDLCIF